MHIVIDFDGVIVSDKYPKIGELKRHSKQVINKWYDEGHIIIINTCRTNKYAQDVKDFLQTVGIKYNFLNENDPSLIEKYDTDCRKIGGDIYIDDKNLGCKIVYWKSIEKQVDNFLNHKPYIICIVGESGSGKTTLADYIESQHGIPSIQSYTDRPKRHPNETGHTFVTKEEYNKFSTEDMVASAKFGDYRYCCLKKDLKPYNVYVIDELAMMNLVKNNDYNVLTIRLKRSEDKRIKSVGEERVKRDEGKFGYYHDYSYCIVNDTTIEEMYDKIDRRLDFSLNGRWFHD